MEANILSKLIGLAVAMLILSLVVEKVANFWKLHGSNSLRIRSNNPVIEKNRERVIQRSTLITGIIIAFLLKADAIQILKTPVPGQVIGWELVVADSANYEMLTAEWQKEVEIDSTSTAIIATKSINRTYFDRIRPPSKDNSRDDGQSTYERQSDERSLVSTRAVFNYSPLQSSFVFIVLWNRYTQDIQWVFWLPVGSLFVSFIALFLIIPVWSSYKNTDKKTRKVGTILLFVLAPVMMLVAYNSGKENYFWPYLSLLIGIVLTGAGISFGSKFWHDLLDTLFYVKRMRGRINDLDTYSLGSAEQVKRYLELSDYDIALRALHAYRGELASNKDIHAVELGKDNSGIYGIEVGVVPGKRVYIKQEVYVDLENGLSKAVPVRVQPMSIAKTQGPFVVRASSKIKHRSMRGNGGSAGCFVRKKGEDKKLLLTCYHVVVPKKDDLPNFTPFGYETPLDDVISVWAGVLSGDLIDGVRNAYIDAAIIDIRENNIDATIPSIGQPTMARKLYSTDFGHTVVQMYGGSSKRREGIIQSFVPLRTIRYSAPSNDDHVIYDLFSIVSLDEQPFSQKGDSGSLITDLNGVALGLLVAGDNERSYAIPITLILSHFNLELIPKNES